MSLPLHEPARHAANAHASRDAQADMAARYAAVRRDTEALAAGLSAEDCVLQSMPDASPVKWHLAHTTWFFETFVLERQARNFAPYHPAYRYLYNSYYNAIGAQYPRAQRGMISRPSLDSVLGYRAHVDARMNELMAGAPLAPETLDLIELGRHHEQQHQELLLTDLKHLLSLNPLAPPYREGPLAASQAPPTLAWHAYQGGGVHCGAEEKEFAFDNERPRHRREVAPFELASRPVTNGEYLEFIADSGYRRAELWLAEGWATVAAHGWDAPLGWRRLDDVWHEFTLRGLQKLDPARPVTHVSQYEADAFARWCSMRLGATRLPTEFEWELAATPAAVQGNFADSGELHPRASPDAPLAALYGDVWEWTMSSYAPYPGYRPAAGAVGEYNGKFMVNQYVLRGGSCATPCSHVRHTYRNFFPSAARWQFSGIRLARDPS